MKKDEGHDGRKDGLKIGKPVDGRHINSSIGTVRPTLYGKTVNLKKKGGTPWETKAGKRTKIKLKSRKPINRQKKIKRNS